MQVVCLYSRGPAPQSSHPSDTIILEREVTKSDYSGSQNLLNNIFLRVTRDLYVDKYYCVIVYCHIGVQ